MGADPIVSNVATASAWRAHSRIRQRRCCMAFWCAKPRRRTAPAGVSRDSAARGARVVIVDDVCTTGASTINAIEAAKEAGMKVAAVVCIVEREEAEDGLQLKMLRRMRRFCVCLPRNDVRAEHVKQLAAA